MDLNELFYRRQVSLARADDATCAEARHAHSALAKGYARRIAEVQVDARSPMIAQCTA